MSASARQLWNGHVTVRGEWKKLRGMGWRERLEYIWTYYRFLLAGLLLAGVLAGEVAGVVRDARTDTVLSLVVVNGSRQDKKRLEELEASLLTCIEADPGKARVSVDASVMTGEQSAQSIKATLSLSYLGGNDLVVCDWDTYEKYCREGAFASWDTLLGEDAAAYEAFRAGEALDLSQSPVWAEVGITGYEPACLCLLQGADVEGHGEAMKKVLEYLFGGLEFVSLSAQPSVDQAVVQEFSKREQEIP